MEENKTKTGQFTIETIWSNHRERGEWVTANFKNYIVEVKMLGYKGRKPTEHEAKELLHYYDIPEDLIRVKVATKYQSAKQDNQSDPKVSLYFGQR